MNAGSPASLKVTIPLVLLGLAATLSTVNLLYHAPLVASKTLLPGDVISFGIGAITVTVA